MSDVARGLRLDRLIVDALTLFGLLAVSLMLVFYALEDRASAFVLAFAVSCLLASLYGFMQGAWPFGAVEVIWAGVAARRWYLRRSRDAPHPLRSKVLLLP